jgi:predicted 3-demethylubiquinone-9 3-methyltransferase (glyoxalase superfamily)
MATVRPFLWFDHQAEEAADHYEAVFAGSSAVEVDRSGGQLVLRLGGTELLLFDGGPAPFGFTSAVSLFVLCADQAEVDAIWDAFLAGGATPGQCGWLTDRFGLSWQVVPEALGRLLGDPDPGRAQRALAAMLTMSRLVVAELEAAAEGG